MSGSYPDEFDQTLVAAAESGDLLCERYRLVREIGRGGMGVVWLAEDVKLDDRSVALKLLPTVLSRNKRAIARLKKEAVTCLDLTHPQIVRLYNFEQDPTRGDDAFLVMQYVQGQTLDDLLAEHPDGLPLDRVSKWAGQLAQALDHAHANQILHRDLKPSNVMIDGEDNALLMDFGIAREAKDTMTRVTGRDSSGTLPYMSPQQVMGENSTSNDIYSLAATLYEALKGEPPFTTGDLVQQIRHVPVGPIDGQQEQVNDALLAGLAKEKEARPGSASELVQTMCGGTPLARPRTAKPRTPDESHGSRKAILTMAVIAVLVTVALGTWWASTQLQGSPGPAGRAEEPVAANTGNHPVEPAAPDHADAGDEPATEAVRNPSATPAEPAQPSRARLSAESAQRSWSSRGGGPSRWYANARVSAKKSEAEQGAASGGRASGRGDFDAAAQSYTTALSEWQEAIALHEQALSDLLRTARSQSTSKERRKEAIEEYLRYESADADAKQLESTILALFVPKRGDTKTVDLGNGETMEFVWIEPGRFEMGSPSSESGRYDDEGPRHWVTIGEGFWLGQTEVTQGQYRAVMGKNPSSFKGSDMLPVEQVSWNDAKSFCERVSRETGLRVRLPSESEWEFACRAGTTTAFNTGSTINTDQANYNGNWTYGNGRKGVYREKTVPVGSFKPNAWGLYDMPGNVWEWCEDVWHDSYQGAPTDGSAWTRGVDQGRRVLRGGSWLDYPRFCRSAFRGRYTPVNAHFLNGFRVCLD